MSPTRILDTSNRNAEVDILIPAHNEVSRIQRCLRSIETQGFKNVRVIILDNASEDATSFMAKKFLETSSLEARLLYSSVKLSLAEVLNTLLDQATAPYLKFLFADDLLGQNVLNGLYKPLAHDHGIVMSYVSRQYFNLNGGCSGPTTSSWVRAAFPNTDDATALVYIGNFIGEPSATMVRTQTVRKLGLRFDDELRQLLDVAFWVQLCQAGQISYVPGHSVLISRERSGETEYNIQKDRLVLENRILRERYKMMLEKNLTFPVKLTSIAYLIYRRIRCANFLTIRRSMRSARIWRTRAWKKRNRRR